MPNILKIVPEGFVLALSTTTLILGVLYALQLSRAPLYKGLIRADPSRGSLVPMYGLLPVMAFLESAFAIFLCFASQSVNHFRLFSASLLAVGWLIVVVIWGHCHTTASINAENPWPGVCYQENLVIEWPENYPKHVSKALGSALVAAGSLVLISYIAIVAVNAAALHRARRIAKPSNP